MANNALEMRLLALVVALLAATPCYAGCSQMHALAQEPAKVVSALGCNAASDAVVVPFAAAQLHRIYMVNARRGHRRPRKGRTVQHFSNTTLL